MKNVLSESDLLKTQIAFLTTQNEELKSEITRLNEILKQHGIKYSSSLLENGDFETFNEILQSKKDFSINPLNQNTINFIEPTRELVSLFYSYFKGRPDVYAKRSGTPNAKTGKFGYYPQCWNFWKDGLCVKKFDKSKKCSDCSNRKYKELQGRVLLEHLKGEKQDCSDVIGLYPAHSNETCYFLVFDFDNHMDNQAIESKISDKALFEEVTVLCKICKQNNIPHLIERSRSGKGIHIWIFFEEAISLLTARKFGITLLTHGAESVNQRSFETYDRIIPSQDHLKNGELGNLIALPLQGQALKNANSAFVDENFIAYENQWDVLKSTKKLSANFIEEKIFEWSKNGLYGNFSDTLAENLFKQDKEEN